MSGEKSQVHDPWPELNEEWAIYNAARSPGVLVMFEIFAREVLSPEMIELARDTLEVNILNQHRDIPPRRIPEVFGRAEAIIWQEMDANGEA